MSPKKLVVLDGMDGTGKTTTIQGLLAYFKEEGVQAVQYREPGGTPVAESMRGILLHAKADLSPLVEFYLFQAARASLLERLKTETAEIVIFDRFWPSTLAYQVHGDGIPRELFFEARRISMQQIVTAGYNGRYVCLELPEDTRLERLKAAGRGSDRFESRGKAYYERVARGYQEYRMMADLLVDTREPLGAVVTRIGRWVHAVAHRREPSNDPR